jgi:ubiquinone/menaquinone biosynthesis C-methylase UbiE
MPDKKYHGAIVEVLDHVKSLIKDGAKVLEIGPGHVPFSKATHFCGWTLEEKSKLQNYKVANVSVDVLPYSNKEFDFVYCRHVIEDLWNPSHCLNEISRVAKEGWIETPSPLCEMTKNVDGSESVTTPWRGYAHHRYMVWNDNDVLKILPKFPMVDYYTNFNQENMKEALKNPFPD